MASGSRLKIKTSKYIIINSSCRVFYYKYTVSLKYVANLNYTLFYFWIMIISSSSINNM